MEELQSRIVVAENLPEDHCHQNLMKIFSTVGSVETIRTYEWLDNLTSDKSDGGEYLVQSADMSKILGG